jgi:hypothetical protein
MVEQIATAMVLDIGQSPLQPLPLKLDRKFSLPQGNHARVQIDACCELHEVTHIYSDHHLITIEGLGKYGVV